MKGNFLAIASIMGTWRYLGSPLLGKENNESLFKGILAPLPSHFSLSKVQRHGKANCKTVRKSKNANRNRKRVEEEDHLANEHTAGFPAKLHRDRRRPSLDYQASSFTITTLQQVSPLCSATVLLGRSVL